MPDNPKIQGYVATNLPNEPVDDIQEGMYRMKIENKEGDSKEFPNRPGEPDCIYYLRTGLCGYGTNCRFNHPPILPSKTAQNRSELPQREGQLDCGYYLKTGICKYGSSCKYHHPLDRRGAGQITLNTLGLPMRQEEKPCPYYMRTYTCKFGLTCKFDHPQPAPLETNLRVPGPILPPTGVPYVAPFPAWQLSRSSHATSSHLPDPQTYMPLVFPPFPTPFTPQSWNTYMGENVCGYFSKFGVCKYGPTCKFEHPMYVTSYILGMPSMPAADPPPFFPSARNVVISNLTETSQSKSSKITDWIQKPEIISDNNCQNGTKKSVDLPPPKEVHDDHPNNTAAPESSERPQDQAE